MSRLRPLPMIPEYMAGDRLDHQDVNSLVERAKRETHGADSAGSASEGIVVDRPRRRPTTEQDGEYCFPLVSQDGKVTPPYAVCQPGIDYNAYGFASGRRGKAVRQLVAGVSGGWPPFSCYMVNGPAPIPKYNDGGPPYPMGWGSSLIHGGWVAVSLKDVDGNTWNEVPGVANPVGTIPLQGPRYGPKPGSWLLWPFRGGEFRVMGPLYSLTSGDRVKEFYDAQGVSDVALAWAYQDLPLMTPEVTLQGGWSASTSGMTSYQSGSLTTNGADSDAADGAVDRWTRNVQFSGNAVKLLDCGCYELVIGGRVRPTFKGTVTGSLDGVGNGVFVSVAPFYDDVQVGAGQDAYVSQIKTGDGSPLLLAADVGLAASWFVNAYSPTKLLTIRAKQSETTNLDGAVCGGHYTLKRVGTVAHRLG